MLEKLLEALGSKPQATVGVAMSPSVGLEMIEINPKTKVIEKYGSRELDYDYTKREIADYNVFIDVLKELFDELKINPKCNVVMSIPAVHYGLIAVSQSLDDEGIEAALLSDVERASYIFKRQSAVLSWSEVAHDGERIDKEIIYSAIQESALDEIRAAFVENGATLVAIEASPNSLLKSLSYNELAEEQMVEGNTWNLMVINPNSYSIITLNGKNIIDYREEPLALRSFIGDEIYDAIISSAQMTLQAISSKYLYIVSETDIVSAEVLSMKIPFDGSIKFLESNKYVQSPLMSAQASIPQDVLLKATPEIIGAGIYQFSDYPIKFNLMGKDAVIAGTTEVPPVVKLGDKEIELTPAKVIQFTIIVLALIGLPAIGIFSYFNYDLNETKKKVNKYNEQMSSKKSELENYETIDKKDTFDIKLETNTVQAYNRAKLIYYSAVGANIPTDAWLVYIKIYGDRKVDFVGRSLTTDSVYAFYKGMKMSVINSDLRLNRLELATDALGDIVVEDPNSIKPKFYEFEMTNLDEEELNALDAELNPGTAEGEGEGQNMGPRRKHGFLYGDFLDMPPIDSSSLEQEGSDENSVTEPPKNLPANLESIEKF